MTAAAVLEIDDLVKDYRSLRPLRIAHLRVGEGERVALVGFDGPSAETLVNLITGAHLPERGVVRLFEQSTADITDGDAWLSVLDRVGIVSDRVVLLDAMTVAQNLALPFSLEIDPIPEAVARDVSGVAEDVGLTARELGVRVGEAAALVRARVNLGRAVALRPRALVLEHATARLSPPDVQAFAADVARVSRARSLTAIALTADSDFAKRVAGRVLTWDARTGTLRERRRWW